MGGGHGSPHGHGTFMGPVSGWEDSLFPAPASSPRHAAEPRFWGLAQDYLPAMPFSPGLLSWTRPSHDAPHRS